MVQDTGGWEPDAKGLQQLVAEQASVAMRTADAIILVVDAVVGATSADEAAAKILQRSGKPVFLAANKVDSERGESDAAALWSLGLGEPYPVSAMHGRGVADLLDEVIDALPVVSEVSPSGGGPRRVALVGKPNVGKSSLLNRLAGDERSVVHDVAGTTVDPVDSLIELGGKTWRFVDTAGLRRKVGQASGHEFYASVRTHGAIDAAEVVIVLIDASQPLTEQDQRVLTMVIEAGRALVLAFNKWDLVDEDRRYDLDREIDRELAQVQWAPRVNISAKTGRAVQKLVPALETALASWDSADLDRPAEHVSQGDRRRDTAAGARRQAAQDPVRHPGDRAAADLRAVHLGFPGGRLPPVPRASAARDVRLRGQPDPDQRAGTREARTKAAVISWIARGGRAEHRNHAVGSAGACFPHDPDRAGRCRRRCHQCDRRLGHADHLPDAGHARLSAGDGDDVQRDRSGRRRDVGHLGLPQGTARPVAPVALADPRLRLGAILGSWLLLHLPEKVFQQVVPVLLVAALVLVVIGPRIQDVGAESGRGRGPLRRARHARPDGGTGRGDVRGGCLRRLLHRRAGHPADRGDGRTAARGHAADERGQESAVAAGERRRGGGLHPGRVRPDQLGGGGPDRGRFADRWIPGSPLRSPAVAGCAARGDRGRRADRAVPVIEDLVPASSSLALPFLDL